MASLSGLPCSVGPQKQSILCLPNISHSGSSFSLFLLLFQSCWPSCTWTTSFHLKWAPDSRVMHSATRFTLLKPAVLISPLSPNFLAWVLRFSTTLPFENDSPLFSAPTKLVSSLFPKIRFMRSRHHTYVHTIPPHKDTFLLSLSYLNPTWPTHVSLLKS